MKKGDQNEHQNDYQNDYQNEHPDTRLGDLLEHIGAVPIDQFAVALAQKLAGDAHADTLDLVKGGAR